MAVFQVRDELDRQMRILKCQSPVIITALVLWFKNPLENSQKFGIPLLSALVNVNVGSLLCAPHAPNQPRVLLQHPAKSMK